VIVKSLLRILLLEDDASDAELVRGYLEADGLVCVLTRTQTRAEFVAALADDNIDLILADYKLPSFDGFSALKLAQGVRPDVPFIMVSGTLGEELAVESVKIGATDYVLKTGLSRLAPAVRRALGEAEERVERKRTEEILREQASLLNLTHDAVCVHDMKGVITYWNRGAETLYGWTAEEVRGKIASEVLRTVIPVPFELKDSRWQGELGRTRKDGTQVVVASRWSVQRDDKGTAIAVLETSNDVTERKQAETLLADEKRILEMVARGASLGEILDGLCRLAEENAAGVLASILLVEGNRVRHGGAPSLPKAYTDAIDGAAIGPSAGSCGTAAYLGQQVIVEDIATDPLWTDYRDLAMPHGLRACWSTPIFSSRGKVIATFAMYYREPRSPTRRDQEIIEQITHLAGVAIERKLTHEQLERSEAYLAEAQRLSHTGSWAFNSTGTLYWSEENFRIWGFDLEQGLPSRDAVLQRIHPEDRGRVYQQAQEALRGQADFAVGFRIILPDGSIKYLEATGHPLVNAPGSSVEIVGTHVDVTERRRAEQERERLHRLEADLAHINRVSIMSELAASLAHELRQPITAAIMNANACTRWLRRDMPELTEACNSAAAMVADAARAAAMIERVRSLYKRETPEQELVDLNEIIQEMTALLGDTARRAAISIHAELDPRLPRRTADRVELQQVLMNLMINGIEAMKDQGGELIIVSKGTEDGQLLIAVSDTGIGLPVDGFERIFEAFFTTKPQGTGMGLSISRRIIESHGGRLWASSGIGRGTTLQFTLPGEVTSSWA
jgi:PAS domain S-box-containing protein